MAETSVEPETTVSTAPTEIGDAELESILGGTDIICCCDPVYAHRN